MDAAPALAAMVQRLEKLERANRSLKMVLLGLLVVLLSVATMGAVDKGPRKIEAESFVLLDAKGHRRAELTVDAGGPGITLFDAEVKARSEYGLSPEGMVLRAMNMDGKNVF